MRGSYLEPGIEAPVSRGVTMKIQMLSRWLATVIRTISSQDSS